MLLLRTPNGNQSDLKNTMQGNLFIDMLLGAKIHTCTPEQYENRNEMMTEIGLEYQARGAKVYQIPEGGSNALGSFGYVEEALELIS